MSSTLLYLAIVAVWAVVLVPMWLRRDASRAFARHPDLAEELVLEELDEAEETPADEYDEPDTVAERRQVPPPRRRRRSTRAAVIARRRRRTFGLTLLFGATVTLVASRQAPWWTALPAAFLLLAHLALLRVAARIDASRRRGRARAAAAARRAAEAAAPQAEVIELPPTVRQDVFDQYAEDRRAVGD